MKGSTAVTLATVYDGTRAERVEEVTGPRPRHLRAVETQREEQSAGDLARAAARAEIRAWPDLVRRFHGLVCGIARSHGLNDADTADVCQAVWIRLLTGLDGIREPDRLAGWLATTARYESIRLLNNRRDVPTGDGKTLDGVHESPDPFVAVSRRQVAKALREMIDTLPTQHRRLIVMLLSDPQPSYVEISEALSMPVGSIGPIRQRCLAVLRRKCVAAGLAPEQN